MATSRLVECPRYGEAATLQLQVAPVPGDPGALESKLTGRYGGASFRQTVADTEVIQRQFVVSRSELKCESQVYIRWSGFRSFVGEVIHGMIDLLSVGSIQQVQLEFWDRFNHEGPLELVDWSELFSPSAIAPVEQLQRRDLWHSHGGWFERDASGRKRLVRINIDGRADLPDLPQGGIGVAIYSFVGLISEPPVTVRATRDDLLSEFDSLHTRSKEVFGSVLTDSAKRSISLMAPE